MVVDSLENVPLLVSAARGHAAAARMLLEAIHLSRKGPVVRLWYILGPYRHHIDSIWGAYSRAMRTQIRAADSSMAHVSL